MLKDVLETAKLHISRAEYAKNEVLTWETLTTDLFSDSDKVKTIDSFIYRFIKLQDIIGQKLFRAYLDRVGDYRDDMSFLDILDRLEKLQIIENPQTWLEYRKLRNELTHEYPDNESEILEGIILAIDAFDRTVAIVDRIRKLSKMNL
jgi:hypothetical protein